MAENAVFFCANEAALRLNGPSRPFRAFNVLRRRTTAPPHAGDKHRQTQVDYAFTPPAGTRQLKSVWSRPMALDRVELYHSGK